MVRGALVLLLAATTVAIAAAPATPAATKLHKVEVTGEFPAWRFEPAELTVAVGDKVVWRNPTSAEHHVTPISGPWREGAHVHLKAEGKGGLVFTEPGTYRYYCDRQLHGQLVGDVCLGQCGTIIVE